jgi:hypothetical protein
LCHLTAGGMHGRSWVSTGVSRSWIY